MRSVGVKNVRLLFKGGVNESLTTIIDYLEKGVLPKWMKDRFHELLEQQEVKKTKGKNSSKSLDKQYQ